MRILENNDPDSLKEEEIDSFLAEVKKNREKPLDDKFKVAFFYTANAGVVYHRTIKFADLMRAKGIGVAYGNDFNTVLGGAAYDPYNQATASWENELNINIVVNKIEGICRCADVIVFGLFHTEQALALLKALKTAEGTKDKIYLMEYDDNFLDVPSYNGASVYYFPGSPKITVGIEQMKLSDGVIASTPYLAKLASQYNKNTYVIPNNMDFRIADAVVPDKHDDIRVVWEGASMHEDNIQIIKPAVQEALKNPNVSFYCLGGQPNFFPELKEFKNFHHIQAWKIITEYYQYFGSFGFDIGLAPLIDNAFNRGKSNLRLIDYSAFKIATIASPVEPYMNSINGGNGLFAKEPEEFTSALKYLIEKEDARKVIGNEAYKWAKQNHDLDKVTDTYISLLKKINGEKR